MINVHTITLNMGRPPKPDNLRRTKIFPLRLSAEEWKQLQAAATDMGVKVAKILREGAILYIERGKDGSLKSKEEEQ